MNIYANVPIHLHIKGRPVLTQTQLTGPLGFDLALVKLFVKRGAWEAVQDLRGNYFVFADQLFDMGEAVEREPSKAKTKAPKIVPKKRTSNIRLQACPSCHEVDCLKMYSYLFHSWHYEIASCERCGYYRQQRAA